jgi:hypothetical protein
VRRFADGVIVGGMLALAASASLTPANTRDNARLSVAGSRLLKLPRDRYLLSCVRQCIRASRPWLCRSRPDISHAHQNTSIWVKPADASHHLPLEDSRAVSGGPRAHFGAARWSVPTRCRGHRVEEGRWHVSIRPLPHLDQRPQCP